MMSRDIVLEGHGVLDDRMREITAQIALIKICMQLKIRSLD